MQHDSIMTQSFNTKSTTTPTKQDVERYIIGPTYRMFANATSTHYAITLIGCVDGFDRQYELLTSAGVRGSNIIIVERDYDTFRSLVTYAYHKGYACHFVWGDFMATLRDHLQKGTQFAIVDFDGTDAVNDYHFDLIDLIEKHSSQVQCANIIASLRTGLAINPPSVYDVCQYIDNHTSYFPAYHSYWGVSAMGIWLLTKQPLPLINCNNTKQWEAVELLRCGFDKDVVGRVFNVTGRTVSTWAAKSRPLWFDC